VHATKTAGGSFPVRAKRFGEFFAARDPGLWAAEDLVRQRSGMAERSQMAAGDFLCLDTEAFRGDSLLQR
jgi:hypothetical protein